jgi:hypothetical protein
VRSKWACLQRESSWRPCEYAADKLCVVESANRWALAVRCSRFDKNCNRRVQEVLIGGDLSNDRTAMNASRAGGDQSVQCIRISGT